MKNQGLPTLFRPVSEHTDGNRVVVAVPITNNATFLDESFIYNYCFTGVIHAIPGQCDSYSKRGRYAKGSHG